jgi:hypothetical protein
MEALGDEPIDVTLNTHTRRDLGGKLEIFEIFLDKRVGWCVFRFL